MYKLQLGNSEEVKSMMALHTQDTVQKGELLSYTRLKHTARTHLDQKNGTETTIHEMMTLSGAVV